MNVVSSNNLVFNGCLSFLRNLNCFIFIMLRFLRNDKMTADFSVMINNGHSFIIFINHQSSTKILSE